MNWNSESNIITEDIVDHVESILKDDESFILDIFEETRIVFWNHEDTDVSQFVCATFTEFVGMLHE